MFPVYTTVDLSGKSLSELKAIARQLGAVPTADLRKRANWVEAILDSQTAIVAVTVEVEVDPDEEDWQDEVPTIIELDDVEYDEPDAIAQIERDFIAEEDAIIDQINILSDVLNFAIFSDSYSADCPGIRKLEEDVDALNFQLQQVANAHREYIQSLCRDIDPIVDIWWQGESNGAVSIDGGQTYRCFRVLDMLSDRPIVKLVVSKGNEIDSRWATTKNNRYMRAVIDIIPTHIKQLASEVWEDGEIVGCVVGCEDQQPPGRGDGRGGRIECVNDEF